MGIDNDAFMLQCQITNTFETYLIKKTYEVAEKNKRKAANINDVIEAAYIIAESKPLYLDFLNENLI